MPTVDVHDTRLRRRRPRRAVLPGAGIDRRDVVLGPPGRLTDRHSPAQAPVSRGGTYCATAAPSLMSAGRAPRTRGRRNRGPSAMLDESSRSLPSPTARWRIAANADMPQHARDAARDRSVYWRTALNAFAHQVQIAARRCPSRAGRSARIHHWCGDSPAPSLTRSSGPMR
jgi:hypothetical protein